jgi:hypothetical protein
VKTTINTSRIPSICAITPTPSDDEKSKDELKIKDNVLNVNKDTGYATIVQPAKHKTSPLMPLNNMLVKIRGVLKKSPNKENNPLVIAASDEYVTITDVKTPKKSSSTNGIYYSSDVLKRNLATVLSGNINEETEYVSLNELPCNHNMPRNLLSSGESNNNSNSSVSSDEHGKKKIDKNGGVNFVKMDAHGKPIYDSNSLKRKKGAITTFSPGPCVKDSSDVIATTTKNEIVNNTENHNRKVPAIDVQTSGIYRKANNIRPVISQRSKNIETIEENTISSVPVCETTEMSSSTTSSSNNNMMRPNGTLSLNLNSVSSKVLSTGTIRGAYVNIQDSAPLRNGPPVYSPPSPSRAASIFAPQQINQNHIQQQQPIEGKIIETNFDSAPPKIVDFVPKQDEGMLSENIDPNMMRAHVKRSNSYRMAAIYADPNDLSKSKESLNVRKSLIDSSDDEPYMNISKTVTRSFEKLIEEFSKSTSGIISTDLMLNESLKSNSNTNNSDNIKRYSLEPPKLIDLNDYMTDSSFDDVMDVISSPKTFSPLFIPSPSKVTLPSDSQCHKARVLTTSFDTEIW